MLIDTMGIDDKEQEQREGSVFSRFFGRLFGGAARLFGRRGGEWDDESDGPEETKARRGAAPDWAGRRRGCSRVARLGLFCIESPAYVFTLRSWNCLRYDNKRGRQLSAHTNSCKLYPIYGINATDVPGPARGCRKKAELKTRFGHKAEAR